jgi:thioredoxin-related protein
LFKLYNRKKEDNKTKEKIMKKSYFVLLFMVPIFLFASVKEGKFYGAQEVHLPNYTYESFLDFPEDIQNLKNENKRFILFVHQKNCPYCARFSEKVLSQKSIKNKILKDFGLIEFNMFGDREVVGMDGETYSEKEYAKKLGLQFTPAILFFDENRTKILQLNGYIKKKKFLSALEYVAKKYENKETFNTYLMNKQNNKLNTDLIDESYINTNLKSLARSVNKNQLAILFEIPQCDECEILHKNYLQEPMINSFLKKLDVAQINLSHNQVIVTPKKLISYSNDFAKSLDVSSAPTIVFFDKKGDEIIRIDSLYKMFHMQSIFDYVVSGAYKNEKEFQRYLTNRSLSIRKQGIDVNIWE